MLAPPIAFAVVLLLVLLELRGMDWLSFHGQAGRPGSGKRKAYACGEDMPENRVQPDYSQFFHFVAFFTIMHVLALVVATAPPRDPQAATIGIGYLLSSVIGIFILFRR